MTKFRMKFTCCTASLMSLLLLMFAFLPSARAQETTAGIEGTVKDKTGASISGANITVKSDVLIGVKALETDKSGYYRFTNLPPGTYTLIVAAPGFAEMKRDGIVLQAGRLPTIDLLLSIGSETTVIDVSAETPQIDVTQSRAQTTISKDEINYAPRGRSFQSAIAFAPGARNEPLQGGFQVDGAATAENSYLIEGQETANMVTGKSAANAPFEFIQEVQVKTSGIEAENGGALGGVVNAIQVRGGNTWHGQLWTYYEADPMDASGAPNANSTTTVGSSNGSQPSLRYDPASSAYSTATRTDYPVQFYTPKKDHFRYVQPGFLASGYLVKDRLWLALSAAPQFSTVRRTVNFTSSTCQAAGNCAGVRQFNYSEQQYFSFGRLDYKATDKIRLFGAWQYAYDRTTGNTLPNADDVYGLVNASISNPVDAYQGALGSVAPNTIWTAGADITLTSNLVATTRFGNFFYNYADRGLPAGDRFLWATTTSATTASLNGTNLASAYANAAPKPSGSYTIGANEGYQFNANSRTSLSQDIAYFKKGFFGAHNLKGGYQLNHLYENVNQIFTNSLIRLGYGTTWSANTTTGQANCATINAYNAVNFGSAGSSSSGACRGNFGYVNIRDGNEVTGQASSNNHGIYIQDSWQIAKGFTANVGVRFEKENLPAYNQYPSGINFGWGSKVAPRIGGAWDVFQNGKLKAFASYGAFYDLMKLNLAIGSFGGNYWHDCVYALDVADYSIVKPQKDATGHYCPKGTGATQQANFVGGNTPAGLRFIENVDYRIPSNDPSQGAAVDPAIKPYRQHETAAGLDYQISKSFALETRYTRRRLDHAIEDVGYVGPNGEAFIIANPGEGIDAGGATATCPTCKAQPKPARNYDAVEIRLTKVANSHWFGQFAYTYSKLRGNYSGLTSTDVSDAGGARANPNNNRSFDEPYLQFQANGNTVNGLLATDRPNSFKAAGYYRITLLKRHDLTVGGFQQASSGAPLSSFADVNGSAGSYGVFVVGRGNWIDVTRGASGQWVYGNTYVRRTPWYVQTDASFIDEYKINDAHEKWRLGLEANFTNLFNQKKAVAYSSRINSSAGTSANYILPNGSTAGNPNYGILENGYDWQSMANSTQTGNGSPLVLSSQYGLPTAWQAGRSIRLKVKFMF